MDAYFITDYSKSEKNNFGAYILHEKVNSFDDAKKIAFQYGFECIIIDDESEVQYYNYEPETLKYNKEHNIIRIYPYIDDDGWECHDIEKDGKEDISSCKIWDKENKVFLSGGIMINLEAIKRIALSKEEINKIEPNFL